MRSLSALSVMMLMAATPLLAQRYHDPDEAKFAVTNLESLNTSADEYAPYQTPSGRWLYFTSSRTGSANILRAPRLGDGWGDPEEPVEPTVNTDHDEGSFTAPIPRLAQLFELDDDQLRAADIPHLGILTSGRRAGGNGDADIYTIALSYDGANLSAIDAIPGINSEEWDAQGSIASDGSFIVFSSTRPGGMGGMDLWISTRGADGRYGAPVDLGATVNSSENEFAPFIAPDNRTLFFSSNGHGGFGGADIFMTKRDESGSWGAPVNLGEKINTPANELFFFGINRRCCYFASDRAGGKGGLDLYQGAPNIFAPGNSLFHFSVADTTTGKSLPAHLKVVEATTGRTIAELDVDPASGADLPLTAGFSYRIEASSPGFPTASQTIAGVAPDTTVSYAVNFGSVPPPPPPPPPVFSFNLDNVTVPLFISGYYRLNTPASLTDLRGRQTRGDLKGETYITDISGDRDAYQQSRSDAEKVEKILNDFVRLGQEEYFPNFAKYTQLKYAGTPKEYIEITVYGFADPRPIIGTYSENPVTFLDSNGAEVTVRNGESLDNFKLAGLRAHYAVEYLDRLFRASPKRREYASLLERNLIRWRAVSGSVDDLSAVEDLGTRRRIRANFRLMPIK